MSGWISGLADKAENILNKIDQNAATALQLPPPNSGASSTDTMKRSMSSNSSQSLKSVISPVRSNRRPNMMSLSGGSATMADMLEARSNKVDWQVGDMSRSSSLASMQTHSMTTIDVHNEVVERPTPERHDTSDKPSDKQELIAFKIALNEITSERNELRQQLSAMNNDMEVVQLRQRVSELESLQQRLVDERDQCQQDLHDSQNANAAYIHSISELESNLAKLQQEYLEMVQKLQIQMRETEQLRQELQEYRSKAQRALQLKDNLIAELKGRGNSATTPDGLSGTSGGGDDDDMRLLQLECDTLKQEQQSMLEEKHNLELQLEQLHSDLGSVNKQHKEQVTFLRAAEDTLRKELRAERERVLAGESEQRLLAQELDSLRQQLSTQMAASATRLQEKEQQLKTLRAEHQSRYLADGRKQEDIASLGDYASRIKVLTQSLVDKQSSVEQLTVERNALRIQMEKLQDKLQQSIYTNNLAANNASRNALLSNSTDDAKAQYPLLMRANPFDNRVARRMKRAYSSLDSAGIRLNAFLRRNPLMRIFVLVYVALLHIWVIFVLLSTTPN